MYVKIGEVPEMKCMLTPVSVKPWEAGVGRVSDKTGWLGYIWYILWQQTNNLAFHRFCAEIYKPVLNL